MIRENLVRLAEARLDLEVLLADLHDPVWLIRDAGDEPG
jgi:hypothetical protein